MRHLEYKHVDSGPLSPTHMQVRTPCNMGLSNFAFSHFLSIHDNPVNNGEHDDDTANHVFFLFVFFQDNLYATFWRNPSSKRRQEFPLASHPSSRVSLVAPFLGLKLQQSAYTPSQCCGISTSILWLHLQIVDFWISYRLYVSHGITIYNICIYIYMNVYIYIYMCIHM